MLLRSATVHGQNAWLGTFCPDGKDMFYANVRDTKSWTFSYYEFPIDTKYDSAATVDDPCTYLVTQINNKYRDINLLDDGLFGATTCKRRCERTASIGKFLNRTIDFKSLPFIFSNRIACSINLPSSELIIEMFSVTCRSNSSKVIYLTCECIKS